LVVSYHSLQIKGASDAICCKISAATATTYCHQHSTGPTMVPHPASVEEEQRVAITFAAKETPLGWAPISLSLPLKLILQGKTRE